MKRPRHLAAALFVLGAAATAFAALAFANNVAVVARQWGVLARTGFLPSESGGPAGGFLPWLDWAAIDLSCATTFIPLLGFLLATVIELPSFGRDSAPTNSPVIQRYLEHGLEETGAVNAVAGMILDYRAFDTLGESHVLFTAAMAVLILLLSAKERPEPKEQARIMQADPILRQTARIIVPMALVYGVYIIFTGHLGPGGGFSGGAVIGGALILYAIAFGFGGLEKVLNLRVYRTVVVCALCFYSLAKCYSFYCGANHLETIFRTGTPGAIFSAGLILPLNIAVGIVVACTMYGFYSLFQRGRI